MPVAYKQKHPYIMQLLYILKYKATHFLKGRMHRD